MSGTLRRGPRVHIRLLDPADEEEFLRLARASRALHRPWSHPPTTAAAFRELFGDDEVANERIVVCRNADG
ncbi:MAG TPA: RimJ/RimL family protein N-acetyltransferase, partial [Actinomycetota bacterium]|nr:RimJ/RimL family protein N-acetyltransferase [Actinomycetota bacterium]